jgi:hypothetical protein
LVLVAWRGSWRASNGRRYRMGPEGTYKEVAWDTDMRALTRWSFADDTTFRPRSTWIPLVLPALGGISR